MFIDIARYQVTNVMVEFLLCTYLLVIVVSIIKYNIVRYAVTVVYIRTYVAMYVSLL